MQQLQWNTLTTRPSRSDIAKMKAHTQCMRVPLSMPPHIEHKTFCFAYSFMKRRVHSRCSILPFSGNKSVVTSIFQSVTAINTQMPKCSRNSLSSVVVALALLGSRCQISLALRRKSSTVGGVGRSRFCRPEDAIVRVSSVATISKSGVISELLVVSTRSVCFAYLRISFTSLSLTL